MQTNDKPANDKPANDKPANDKPAWVEREREEIAARVAHFRATQKKFEKEREEYYTATLSNAWDGFNRPAFWN